MRLLLIFLMLCNGLVAQNIVVTDVKTGKPLEGVTIISTKPNHLVITNVRGRADISGMANSKTIAFRLMGYRPVSYSYDELKEKSFSVRLETANINVGEVVVSATRFSQTSEDLPFKVTSLKPKEIALQNPQTAADLLATSGEVFVQKSQQGGGSPMIRGFATNRLLYTVDGVRMNNAIFRGGNIQNVISLDPFALESAEVLFGPASVNYGSDAIGAVMAFQTLRPQLSLEDKPLIKGSATTRYSSANNERTAHFHVNVGWRKWALLTSFSHQNFDNLRMGSHGPDEYLRHFHVQRIDSADRIAQNSDPRIQNPTGYTQDNFMQKLLFKPNRFWSFEYAFHYSETSPYGRYDRLIETRNGLPRSAVWDYGPQKWSMNHVTINHSKITPLYHKASLRLAHQFFEESRIDRPFSGGNRNRLRTQREMVDAYSANLDFVKYFNNQTLSYGVEAVFNDVRSRASAIDIRTNQAMPVADRYPQADWGSYAAYFNYQYKFSSKFSVQGGVRYNHFNVEADFTRNLIFYPLDFATARINNGAVVGSAGLIWRSDNGFTLRNNYSTSFRAPNVDDMGKIFDMPQSILMVPNPGLNAEYAYNAEVGAAKVFGSWLRIDASAYFTYLDNALVRRDFTVNGQDSILYDGELNRVQAIQNAAFATVYGIQAEVEAEIGSGFSVSSRANYQRGTEEMDNGEVSPSRHAAPWFGLTRVNYRNEILHLQFYAMYSGEVTYNNLNFEERTKPHIYAIDEDGNPWSPAWYTLNIKAMYSLTEQLTLTAGVENLTDQRYRPYSSGLVAPGRNFIMALRATF